VLLVVLDFGWHAPSWIGFVQFDRALIVGIYSLESGRVAQTAALFARMFRGQCGLATLQTMDFDMKTIGWPRISLCFKDGSMVH
jgi:hypothetical protein